MVGHVYPDVKTTLLVTLSNAFRKCRIVMAKTTVVMEAMNWVVLNENVLLVSIRCLMVLLHCTLGVVSVFPIG